MSIATRRPPVDKIPPEVLGIVFHLTRASIKPSTDIKATLSLLALSSVSLRWRRIATTTSSLWTDISITTTQSSYDFATLSLKRSSTLPICLHIYEPEQGDRKSDDYPRLELSNPTAASSFITLASPQIHRLYIQSWGYFSGTANEILRLCLNHSSPGITKTLHVRRPNPNKWEEDDPWFDWDRVALQSITHSEAILKSITTLYLQDSPVSWNSTIYHSLVDLRLHFQAIYAHVSTSQFANILLSSPRLVTLKISSLYIKPSAHWSPIPISLPYLEVLYLGDMLEDSWKALLSVLSLSGCSRTLNIGMHESDLHLASPSIAGFLCGSRFKTLVFSGTWENEYKWAFPSLEGIATLDNLVIDNFRILGSARQTKHPTDKCNHHAEYLDTYFKSIRILGELFADTFQVDCRLMVPLNSMENICLSKRISPEEWVMYQPQGSDPLVAKLRDTFPKLYIYIIPSQGNTSELACARMLDA